MGKRTTGVLILLLLALWGARIAWAQEPAAPAGPVS